MGEISKKVKESRLKWCEVVYACIEKGIRICGQNNDGDRGAGEKQDIGIPKWMWLDNIRNDLSETEQGRCKWMRPIRIIDPT